MRSDFDIWRCDSGDPETGDSTFIGVVTAENSTQAVAIAGRRPPAARWRARLRRCSTDADSDLDVIRLHELPDR